MKLEKGEEAEVFMGTYWTIQSAEKWEEIQRKSYLTGNPHFIYPEFIEAYHWIMKKMKQKIPNYQGEYPVWLWIDRPDLRKSGHLSPKERGVLLKINIEETRALFSDFEAWHFVLNRWYFDLENFESDKSDFLQHELEKSWEKIFDIDFLKQHPNWGASAVQGVTNRIELNEITLIKEFIAR
ncbi:DUF3841 domain-containing protein [Pseudobacillus badius]|uniref:DUF3841 domain-containing protein n=1 Tax=Bacillus badius TaxID=1455 RepID=UPI0007B0778A|nr:DUF3841 domain-containing protein [Bacillus badius]KZN98597.1 hypothetical protein A4244_19595 [Bacillus badius]OCS83487.1 hypothetical protein A6M11_19610 [Bacillus badius]OVE46908.1 DUF3841 domain-containing protein [Bacillus badius]